MDKPKDGVYVVVCCPMIKTLRTYIELEEFTDCPIDKFLERRVSDFIEELLISSIELKEVSFGSLYDLILDEILTFISHYVNIHGVRSISTWYDDTLLIHCLPSGVKHVKNS